MGMHLPCPVCVRPGLHHPKVREQERAESQMELVPYVTAPEGHLWLGCLVLLPYVYRVIADWAPLCALTTYLLASGLEI